MSGRPVVLAMTVLAATLVPAHPAGAGPSEVSRLLCSSRAVAAGPVSQRLPASVELTIDADQIVYDDVARVVEATGQVAIRYRGISVRADSARIALDAQRLEATGRVTIVDAEGREMRGDVLVYDAAREAARLSSAETIVSGVYLRAALVEATPGRIDATDVMLTTCNPAAPAYRVTAARIEVIPDDRITASSATFWVGRHWVLGLPMLVVSLRSAQETAGSFPSVGYNTIDGLWASYRYAFRVGTPLASVSTTAGTLAQRVEAGLLLSPQPLVGSVQWSAALSAGWHREQGTGVETTRLRYEAGLHLPSVPLGPQVTARASWTWREAAYATGDRLGLSVADAVLTSRLSPQASLSLSYAQLRPVGTTPLAADAVHPADVVDRLSAGYETAEVRSDGGATRFGASVSYDFLTRTPSVGLSYGEAVIRAYHWSVSPSYNLATHITTLGADVGVAVGTDTYVTVRGKYNTATTLFEDLDYMLTTQIEGCFELAVTYRQIRQEVWVSLGLAAFPQARVQFQLPGP